MSQNKCQVGQIKYSEGTRLEKRGWEDRRKQDRRQRRKEQDGENMVDEKNKRHVKENSVPRAELSSR